MRTRTLIISAGCALVALAGLLVAGSRSLAVRTFALDAPDEFDVAVLHPGTRLCEGPVISDGSAGAVRIWGGPTGGPASVEVTAQDVGTHRILAAGRVETAPGSITLTAPLDHPILSGRPVQVCLLERRGGLSVAGYPAVDPHVIMAGRLTGPQPVARTEPYEFSLVLLSSPDRSLIGSLSTAFSRAALWRPSWVGSWTFWALTIGFLMMFGVAAVAVALAAADDDAPAPPRRDAPPDDGRPRPTDPARQPDPEASEG